MDKKKIENQESILEGIDNILDEAFDENEEFNLEFDGIAPLKFKSYLSDNEYSVEPSAYLFRFDRTAYFEEIALWENRNLKSTHQGVIDYLKKEKLTSIFIQLVQAIQRKRIAPFIGAGLSIPLNYPSWGKALNEIHDKVYVRQNAIVKKQIQSGDYLEAAESLYKKDKRGFTTYITDNFYFDQNLNITDISIGGLKYLNDIAHSCVITTNFDKVIEKLFEYHGKPFEGTMLGEQQYSKFASNLIAGNRCILKLHGNVGEEETYIFTKSQYDKAYGKSLSFDKNLPKTLRQIFISHSLLFLGCSLERDKTLELFQKVYLDGEFQIPEHFAILPLPKTKALKQEKENFLRDVNIKVIWYPSDSHDYVEKLLKLSVDIASGKMNTNILKS